MTSKKRKEIAQEVKSLETKGLDANQKAIELAKLAEKTQQTFNSLDRGVTTELIQEQNQSARETQQAVSAKHDLEIGKIEEVYDELEQTKDNLSKATSSNVSDINKLQNLQKKSESVGIDSSHISQAEQEKNKENNLLSQLEQSIDGTQAQLRQQLDQSKKRRLNAQDSYRNKDLGGTDKKTESTPLDAEYNKNLNDVVTENSQDENPAKQNIYLAGVDIEKLTEQFNDIKDSVYSFFEKIVALATVGTSLFVTVVTNRKVSQLMDKAADISISATEFVDDFMNAVEVSNRTIGAESFPLPEDSLPKQVKELSDKQRDVHQLSDEAQDLVEIEDDKRDGQDDRRKKKKSKKS